MQAKVRAVAATVLIPGLPFLARFWIRRSSRDHIRCRAALLSPRDVAIVPGCLVLAGGSPSPMLADRLATGLELYRLGLVGRILVSGNSAHPRGDEVAAMGHWLRKRAVPESDLLLDGASLRTRDTMQRAARIFGLHSVTICTQRFHLPRSIYLALHAGLDAQGLEADHPGHTAPLLQSLRELAAQTTAFVEEWGRS